MNVGSASLLLFGVASCVRGVLSDPAAVSGGLDPTAADAAAVAVPEHAATTNRATGDAAAAPAADVAAREAAPPLIAAPAWAEETFTPSRASYGVVLPARAGDGSVRLVMCAMGVECRSYSADGSARVVHIGEGSVWPPAVGDLDPAPGEEVIVADGDRLRLFSADLVPLREIRTSAKETFGADLVTLADLDGDGSPEILAVARSRSGLKTTLNVYRRTGELFSSRYPLPVKVSVTDVIRVVTPDLDGDGRREILLAVPGHSATQYDLLAFRADGSPYPGWSAISPPGNAIHPVAADLDHDRRPQIVLRELSALGDFVRVLDASGAVRPGWPVILSTYGAGPQFAGVAVADLDRDGHDEIVVNVDDGLLALRADGSPFGRFTWPTWGPPGPPVVADIDNDGFPDLTVSYNAGDTRFADNRLRALTRTGALIMEWRLGIFNGREPGLGFPAIGDFTGDGRTDIAVGQSLREPGPTGATNGDLLRLFTGGGPFDPALAAWPVVYRDPANSCAKP